LDENGTKEGYGTLSDTELMRTAAYRRKFPEAIIADATLSQARTRSSELLDCIVVLATKKTRLRRSMAVNRAVNRFEDDLKEPPGPSPFRALR
jgi:hypothetical protein